MICTNQIIKLVVATGTDSWRSESWSRPEQGGTGRESASLDGGPPPPASLTPTVPLTVQAQSGGVLGGCGSSFGKGRPCGPCVLAGAAHGSAKPLGA